MFIDETWLSTQDSILILWTYLEIPHTGISGQEVFNLQENIEGYKATSSADFSSLISNNNSHTLCAPVTQIINNIISTGSYPELWKKAEVSPILKTENPTQCKDMSPISILFHLGKPSERVIANNLRASLAKHDQLVLRTTTREY